jgi:gliding motility-associated-like protein
MKRLLLLFACLFVAAFAHATHNIAGEITIACISGNTYKATVTTYTNATSPADRCELTIEWGDGTQSIISRSNGATGQSCGPNVGMGLDLTSSGYPNTKMNIYEGTHNYPGPGFYQVKIKDPNRVVGISNIPNSVNVPFFLQTSFYIDPSIGCNSSPTLTTIPLDKACKDHCFYHNPGAVDPDGDSLSYSIGPCLDTNGLPIPGYTLPNISGGGSLSIDPVTGDISWCSPAQDGKYNMVIYIDEWKKFPNGNSVKVGTVLRDMSIDVLEICNNENPDIPPLPDLCVDAGQTVNFSFTVTDPDVADLVKLQGYGGPFTSTSPVATLSPNSSYLPVPYNATFNWQTSCDNVRLQPWTITLKATDNDIQVPLTDIESVNITVVSQGPGFLTALPQASQMNLTWGQNPCNPVSNYCRGYRIYRRQGPSGWNPSQCETGVPAYTGFVLIGTVQGVTNTTFSDNNGGAGLIPGIDYCYRVCAFFNDGAESYASPEACNELLRDIPVLTNVDVMSTGANDDIYVGWVNPLANGVDFDTVAKPGPYKLVLERSQGFTFVQSSAVVVTTLTSPTFYQLPESFIDNGLNTVGTPYTYRLTFYYMTDSLEGSCQPASSVFLSAAPSDNTVTLSWQYNVPWTNYEFAVYRFNPVTTFWDSIALATGNSYADDSLLNGVEYCYYVTAHGSYYNATLPPILYNRSQRTCATPIDLTPPCPPSLIVNSDCYIGLNQLVWTNPMNSGCGTDDVVAYHIWFSPVQGDPLQLIATITSASDTDMIYEDLFSVAGCYAITALDTFNNESVSSNVVCVDNCPTYELPNVFTPNGDITNDMFIPFPYRNVKDIDIKIYDRWGVLVFETTDPDVRWDGRDKKTGNLCTDGVYYYTCTVNEIRLQGVIPRQLKGFVHLFGKDIGQFH